MELTFGKKLKQLRQERGWTQLEVSRRSGVQRGYLAQLETDVVAKPSADVFLKLARAFNIRPEELYQAAGYISFVRPIFPWQKETPEDILNRLRVAQPISVPIYTDFPVYAGGGMEPIDYVYLARPKYAGRNIEGYLIQGDCLEPTIKDKDFIIVDRDLEIHQGDVIAGIFGSEFRIGRLKKIAEELYLENNDGRIKFDECQVAAPVIEVIRRLR